jgi:hypothetical protein
MRVINYRINARNSKIVTVVGSSKKKIQASMRNMKHQPVDYVWFDAEGCIEESAGAGADWKSDLRYIPRMCESDRIVVIAS